MQLADNDTVLTGWQNSAGASQAAELVKQSDGSTRIEWKGGVTVDIYSNTATGSAMLNPATSGVFNSELFQSDLRSTTDDGRLMFLQLSGMRTNDRALQGDLFLLQSAQLGVIGRTYQIAMGDVVPNFSALGTSFGLRGVLAEKHFGRTVVSASAGALATDWDSLINSSKRTQYVRNVASTKVDIPLGESSTAFASFQGYSDDTTPLNGQPSLLAPASGRAGTVGYAYRHDNLSVNSELGYSLWEESSQAARRDHAYLIDAIYNGIDYTLWGGRHRLGAYYTSLSTQAAAGIAETYVGGNWRAASWLNLQGDVRSSDNSAGAGTFINATTTDGVNLAQTISFGGGWQELSLMLNQGLTGGTNVDSSRTRNSSYGGALNYTKPEWNMALGLQHRLEHGISAPLSGTIDTWTWQFGKSFTNDLTNPLWRADLQFTTSLQNQSLDLGESTHGLQYGINVSASHFGWGSLSASWTLANIQPTGQPAGQPIGVGTNLRNHQYLLEATHVGRNGSSIKVYVRNTQLFSGDPSLKNSTRSMGLQLAYVF